MLRGEPAFTRGGFLRGTRMGIPFALNSLVNGLVFGVLCIEVGMAFPQPILMSGLVVSGSGQYAALEVWSHPVAVATVAGIVFFVNLRFIILGSALPSWFGGVKGPRTYGVAFFLTDESWAIAIQDAKRGGEDPAVLVGSGAIVYAGWIVGTAVGFLLAPPVITSLPGLRFLVPALLVAVLCGFWDGPRRSALPWVVASVTAVVAERFLPGTWYVILGGCAGAFVGAWHERG